MSNTSKADTSNNQMQSQTKKPFCKVCFDAGKTIAEYSTHYVRDRPGGVVVCPTMLKQQCKYCKKNGHTPKHCPELEGKHEQPAKPKAYRKPTSLLPVPIIENKNNFKSLALNDGFPVVGEKDSGKIIRPAPVKLNAWASVVAKGPQKKAEQPQAKQPQAKQPQAQAPAEEQAPAEQAQAQAEAQAPAETQAPAEAQAQAQAEQPQAQAEQPQAQAEQADEYIPQDYSKCSWADY